MSLFYHQNAGQDHDMKTANILWKYGMIAQFKY
jgi:hypothetical protein